MPREANWSRSNFSWGTFRCRRPSATLDASSGFDQPLMIALASSRLLELDAIVEGLPTIWPQPRLLLPPTSDPAETQRRRKREQGLPALSTAANVPLHRSIEKSPWGRWDRTGLGARPCRSPTKLVCQKAEDGHFFRPTSALTAVGLERTLTTSGCRVGLLRASSFSLFDRPKSKLDCHDPSDIAARKYAPP
jgi:hypothetical protein